MKSFLIVFLFSISLIADNYQIEEMSLPKNIELSLGGICLDHSGNIMVSTRSGEVLTLIDGAWLKIAEGLQEPMSMVQSWREGEYFALQRAEITKMVDEDRDRKFDLFETFAKGWEFTGNKNEFAMAMTTDIDGNFYLGTSLSLDDDGFANAKVKNRGIIYKIDYVGEKEVFASGAYKPVGAAFNNESDLFISENQGGYFPANCLIHVEQGDFLGNPVSLMSDPSKQKVLSSAMRKRGSERVSFFDDIRKKPAVYLPEHFSGSGFCFDNTDGKFGPYTGQIFLTDFDDGTLSRVYLEKINGQYQGAVFTFLKDERLNALRPIFDLEGQLILGKGGDGCCASSGLLKLKWNGVVTFDVKSIQATKTGFRFTFTKALSKTLANSLKVVNSFAYEYTAKIDAKKIDEQRHEILKSILSDDGLELELVLKGFKAGKVYEINYGNFEDSQGEKAPFSKAFYTLNQIPN